MVSRQMTLNGTNPALGVALYARLYRLLADRPEFQTADTGARLDKALTLDAPGSLPLLDRVMIARATGTDLMCGYAVAKLRRVKSAALLDVLGMLDPQQVVAMYYALPSGRRSVLLSDPAWAYHVQRVDPAAVAEATAYWDDVPALTPPDDMSPAAQADWFRAARAAERKGAGLAPALSPADQACNGPLPREEDQ